MCQINEFIEDFMEGVDKYVSISSFFQLDNLQFLFNDQYTVSSFPKNFLKNKVIENCTSEFKIWRVVEEILQCPRHMFKKTERRDVENGEMEEISMSLQNNLYLCIWDKES